MDNKVLGILLVIVGLLFGVIVTVMASSIEASASSACSCTDSAEGGVCPHAEHASWPTYVGIAVISILVALGLYLLFFEKSQKEIMATLQRQKETKNSNELFNMLLKGMSPEEQKVMRAVKEQNGIGQSTLRLRTDLHKSKLSIVLKELEAKGLIKKVAKGKNNQIFLKIKV